jgi:flagellar protein FliO/FliZ
MNAPPDMITTALKMFAALAIVLGGLFVVFYWARRFSKLETTGSPEKLIKVLANKFIGVKKNICVVEVPGALLVLGISGDQINLLTKIEDQAILEKIRPDETARLTPTFSEHLSRMTSKLKFRKNG